MGCCDSAARARAFSSIDGTPTYYWRDGTRDRHTFYCSDGTYERLVNWIRHLRYLSGKYGDATAYDALTYLVLAGAYVCRNDGCVSLHNYGRAIDLDRVSWSNGLVSDPYFQHHASSYRRVRRRYLALDAVCRRYFRYVLDGYYNRAHTDHIHMDDSALPAVCRKESPSDAVFVQKCCNDFMGYSLLVDGVWGPATDQAFADARRRLRIDSNPHVMEWAWQAWCSRAAAHGFQNSAFGTIPFSTV